MSDQTPSGSSPSAMDASLIGEVLDRRYRILNKIGEGGMGEVYAAEHIHLGKRRAIKLLRPEIVSNKEAVNRFYQEARSASSIGHKNIISIEDFGELPDGRIFMAMELLNGAPLNDLIKQPMPVDRLLNILIQTGHGLAAAHAKGITHRDMKPENIYVTIGENGEDVPKLLDFGIAKVAGNDGQNNLTKTGTIFGTPFYMAPEQALGQQVDARADVYAMGVIMYEVFSGSLPFQGESFMGILTQHITTEPEPVLQRAATAGRQLPPGVPEIIGRCMQKDPSRRFPSMDAMVKGLVDVYRLVAGAGMSSYMEAFVTPRTGAHGSHGGPYHGTPPPSGPAGLPTVMGPGGPGGTGGMTPMPNYGSAPHPVAHSPSGHMGQMAGTPGSGLYPVGSSGLVEVAPKKSKAGLIIALIALLAVAGGVTVFIVLGNKDKGGAGAGTGTGTDGSGGSGTIASGTDTPPAAADAGGPQVATADAAPATGGTVDAAAVATTTADARPTAAEPVMVIVDAANVSKFEVWENGKKLGTGATAVKVTPGTTRTITLKSKGYEDRSVALDGKDVKPVIKLDKIEKVEKPLDCSKALKEPKNPKCVDQYCRTHPSDDRCLE